MYREKSCFFTAFYRESWKTTWRRWKYMHIWTFIKLGIHKQTGFKQLLMLNWPKVFAGQVYTHHLENYTNNNPPLHKEYPLKNTLMYLFFHFFTWLLQWGCPPLVWELKSVIFLLYFHNACVVRSNFRWLKVKCRWMVLCFQLAPSETQVWDPNNNGCCWDQKIWMTMPDYPPIALNVPSLWCW